MRMPMFLCDFILSSVEQTWDGRATSVGVVAIDRQSRSFLPERNVAPGRTVEPLCAEKTAR